MSGPTDSDATPGQDEREIRALVDGMFDAWGRGDAAAYHADFTDDADYVSFDGSRRGKADSISSHANLFPTVLYGSRLVGEVESVRFLTPDVAVVHLLGSIVEGWRQQPLRRRLSRQHPARLSPNGDPEHGADPSAMTSMCCSSTSPREPEHLAS